ncbi:MAG: hypothetical protein QM278_08440 [Pseudomonadota bacterium]|nr:hypothetical protein [Pseudomonadota bacterium]
MKKRTLISAAILVLVVGISILAAALIVLARSPRAVNALAAALEPMTGIRLQVRDLSFDHRLRGYVQDLQIHDSRERGFAVSLARAEIDGGIAPGFKLRVERLVLEGPKFTFHLKDEESKSDPFAALGRIPPVKRLVVKDGLLELKTPQAVYSIPGLEMTIDGFDPAGRGKLFGRSGFRLRAGDAEARGEGEVALEFRRFSPRPSAFGSLRLSLAEGAKGGLRLAGAALTSAIRLDDGLLTLNDVHVEVGSLFRGEGRSSVIRKGLQVVFQASYDQRAARFSLADLKATGAGLGTLTGGVSGTVKPLSWEACLRSPALDLAGVLALAEPLLPGEYRGWTCKGRGGLEVESRGKTQDGTTVWEADVTVDFRDGGFASADGTKAGERISGRVELKLGGPEKGRPGNFRLSLEGGGGELLWESYYNDFRGEKARIVSRGDFAPNPFSLVADGTGDIFRSGDYGFSVRLSPERRILSLQARRISLPRLFSVAARDFLRQNYPDLQDLRVEGEADLELTATASPEQTTVAGEFGLRGGSLRSPSHRLVLEGVEIALPYDLVLAGKAPPRDATEARRGSMAFSGFEKGDLRIGGFAAPVILSGNRFSLPESVALSIFGGEVRLADLEAQDILRPERRVKMFLEVRGVDLAAVTGRALPIPLSGVVNGVFSPLAFQDGLWTSRGAIVVEAFGGRIAAENLFGGRLLSHARFFGGDAVFEGIDLEALTYRIEIGRMTGIVRGALKEFRMEYGQPSRFELTILSDDVRDAPRRISVEAIENLSIISTGSGAAASVMSSGLNMFFKDYPYSRIGIRCALADDIFSLRGLVHEGGTEYLVRRAWLRGIDIINQNPDNSIGFKDMAERVGRIRQSRQEGKGAS